MISNIQKDVYELHALSYKDLEHLWILVSQRFLEPLVRGYQGTTIILKLVDRFLAWDFLVLNCRDKRKGRAQGRTPMDPCFGGENLVSEKCWAAGVGGCLPTQGGPGAVLILRPQEGHF
jgi:hypothetical protein